MKVKKGCLRDRTENGERMRKGKLSVVNILADQLEFFEGETFAIYEDKFLLHG